MIASDFNVDGGSLAVGLLAFGLAVATIGIGIWVAYRIYRGYQQSGERPTLFLAVGIALAFSVYSVAGIVFPTAGASSLLTTTVAVSVQIVGLGFVLYAIHGRPEYAADSHLGGVLVGGIVAVFALVIVSRRIVDPGAAVIVINALAALVGGFVATQAYRGYQRYNSQPMLLLATGILLLTVGSFLGAHIVDTLVDISDAAVLVVVGVSELAGLILVLRSLTGD